MNGDSKEEPEIAKLRKIKKLIKRFDRWLAPRSSVHGMGYKLVFAIVITLLSVVLYFKLLIDRYTDRDLLTDFIRWLPWPVILAILALACSVYIGLAYYRKKHRGIDVEAIVTESNSTDPKRESLFSALEVGNLLYADPINPCSNKQASELALATLFLTACIAPKELYHCIDEHVRADSRSLFIKSFVKFKVPNNFRSTPCVLPAFFHTRGSYPDSLNVLDSTLGTVIFLNLDESTNYIKQVIATCLPELYCYASGSVEHTIVQKIDDFLSGKEVMNEEIVSKRRGVLLERETTSNDGPSIRSLLEKYYSGNDEGLKRAELVIAMLAQMIEAYPICMRVSLDAHSKSDAKRSTARSLRYLAAKANSMSVTFSYRLPLLIINRRGVKDHVCWKAGEGYIRNNKTIYYGLGNADRTQSYHLQILDDQDAFCSLIALRRIEAAEARSGRKAQKANRESPSKQMGFPTAEMAYVQTLREQRHVSMSIKSGRGFSNWFLMFRHEPRFSTPYALVLIASLLILSLLTAILMTPDTCNIGACNNDACNKTGDLNSFLLTGVSALSAVALAAVAKTGRRSRGDNFLPLCVGLVCACSSVILFLYSFKLLPLPLCFMTLDGGLLLTCCIATALRFTVWALIAMMLRRAKTASINLLEKEGPEHSRLNRGLNWSAGWIGIDANRFVEARSGARASDLFKDTGCNAVMEAFIPLANDQRRQKPAIQANR